MFIFIHVLAHPTRSLALTLFLTPTRYKRMEASPSTVYVRTWYVRTVCAYRVCLLDDLEENPPDVVSFSSALFVCVFPVFVSDA